VLALFYPTSYKLIPISLFMKKISPDNIKEAIEILRAQGVIVYPTDTAYALGGIFNSRKVINQILKIKGRQDEKFTLVASSISQVNKFFKLNAGEKKLAKKYWPGPLSLVVSPKFSVRVPANALARDLARGAGRPLIATSANLTGEPTLYDGAEIINNYQSRKFQPEAIIDVGRLKKIKTSTIVQVAGDEINVIRAGAINKLAVTAEI